MVSGTVGPGLSSTSLPDLTQAELRGSDKPLTWDLKIYYINEI